MKKISQAIAVLGLAFALPSLAQYQAQGQMMMQPQLGQYPQGANAYNVPYGYQPQARTGEQVPQTILANGDIKVKCPGAEDGYRYNQTRVQGSASGSIGGGSDH